MMTLLSKLSVRERWLVLGAAGFLGVVLVFSLIVNPLMSNQQKYARMAQDKRLDLKQFNELASEYLTLKSSLEEIQSRVTSKTSNMSLLAAMEGTARKLGLADRIASMKPFTSELESGIVQSSVEMRVEKIDLKGLVQLVEAIETGPEMAVTTRMRIKTRFDDPELLDTTLLVTTVETR